MSDRATALLAGMERVAPAPRREDGEVACDEPWQARLVALTACALRDAEVEGFASALAGALARTPQAQTAQGYYTAWLRVLEAHLAPGA